MEYWVLWQTTEEGCGVDPTVDGIYESKAEALMAAAKKRRDGWNSIIKEDNPEDTVKWDREGNNDRIEYWMDSDTIIVSKAIFYKKGEFIKEIEQKEGGDAVVDLRTRAEKSIKAKSFFE